MYPASTLEAGASRGSDPWFPVSREIHGLVLVGSPLDFMLRGRSQLERLGVSSVHQRQSPAAAGQGLDRPSGKGEGRRSQRMPKGARAELRAARKNRTGVTPFCGAMPFLAIPTGSPAGDVAGRGSRRTLEADDAANCPQKTDVRHLRAADGIEALTPGRRGPSQADGLVTVTDPLLGRSVILRSH